MSKTKRTTDDAMRIYCELLRVLPTRALIVTPREATMLCERYGVTDDKFRRIAKSEQNARPIPLAQVAREIADKQK